MQHRFWQRPNSVDIHGWTLTEPRIRGVGTHDGCGCHDVALHGGDQLVLGEAGGEIQFSHVECVHGEAVPMRDRIVPRRRATVITVPGTTEVCVAIEPHRVVVLAMDTNRCRICRLSPRSHIIGMRALRYLVLCGGYVRKEPMREFCSLEIRRHLTVLLVHVIADTRCVEIDTRHDERLGTVRCATPREVRIPVARKGHMAFFGWFGKGVIPSDRFSVGYRGTRQLHAALLSPYCDNSRMSTSFIILGSGQDGGAPQVGHRFSVSERRSASSVAVISSEGSVVLLDATPDFRHQSHALLESDRYPADRDTFLDGVFITHAHMGHYGGLMHFGNEAAASDHLPLFGTERLLRYLNTNEPWAALIRNGHLDPIPIDGVAATIDKTLAIVAIPVPHRDEFSDTVALSVIAAARPWLLYLPDIDAWDRWDGADEEISRHDIALLDATFSSSEELPDRDMAAIGHPLVTTTIERFRHLTAETHIILTHINHSNPIGDPSAPITELATVAGFTVAYDGFTLDTGA